MGVEGGQVEKERPKQQRRFETDSFIHGELPRGQNASASVIAPKCHMGIDDVGFVP